MGRTYIPNNTRTENFDVNVAGCNLLSILTEKLALPKANYSGGRVDQIDPPWKADLEKANKSGKLLESKTDEEIAKCHNEKLFDGTPNDFVKWTRTWQEFLLDCKGYEAF